MAPTRKNKKSNRKNTRKSRRCGYRKQAGGANESLNQGKQFMEFHKNQHGGAYLTGAPLSEIDGSMLPQELRSFARIGGLDDSINAARSQGSDQPLQQGGRRKNRKSSKKGRKASKKSKKSNVRKASKKSKKSNGRKASKKSKKSNGRKASKKSRRSRKQYGGALTGAPFNQPTMLLSSSDYAKAGTSDFSNPLLKN